jgi:hypothetical protein
VMGNRPPAGLQHKCVESDDFVLNPSGFWWGADVAGRYRPC